MTDSDTCPMYVLSVAGPDTNQPLPLIVQLSPPCLPAPCLPSTRSGRLDRKIELPHPNERARARIMQIHSRKMNVCKDGANAVRVLWLLLLLSPYPLFLPLFFLLWSNRTR